VHHRRTRGKRARRIDDGREFFVLHHDRFGGVGGLVARLGNHGDDDLADELDAVQR
jgi:hypothetical protein